MLSSEKSTVPEILFLVVAALTYWRYWYLFRNGLCYSIIPQVMHKWIRILLPPCVTVLAFHMRYILYSFRVTAPLLSETSVTDTSFTYRRSLRYRVLPPSIFPLRILATRVLCYAFRPAVSPVLGDISVLVRGDVLRTDVKPSHYLDLKIFSDPFLNSYFKSVRLIHSD